jgi:hypothetical protein
MLNGLFGRAVEERGATLVLFAVWLPVLALFMMFVLDVGNWFEHRRHLQMQADAGALAAGGAFNSCFGGTSGSAIVSDAARQYAGDPTYGAGAYNSQIGGTNRGSVSLLVNSKTYPDPRAGDPAPDDTVEQPPCSAQMVDVKLSESNLPLFFGLVPSLPFLPRIHGHARVEVREEFAARGELPVGVPDVNPTIGRVVFLDEANGTVLGSAPLTNQGFTGGLEIWDNAAAPVSLDVSSATIGVRVILGGGASTTCGDPLVSCLDQILFVQGWSSGGNAAQPNPPLARSTTLFNGSCTDPYFTSATSACTIGVRARVDVGTGATNPTLPKASGGVGALLTATINGVTKPLAYDAATGTWGSAAANLFTINPQAGPLPVTLNWEETSGTVGGDTCRTTGGNKCKGSFANVQRTFSASEGVSGPIKLAQVWEGGSFWVNSFQRGTTHDLVVKVGITASLGNASSVTDPVVSLRVIGGSQNQSLDCDPNYSNLKDELANGCRPLYTKNTGTVCPGSPTALWGTAEPWPCVALQTGSAKNQVPEGMNVRVLGAPKPNTCPPAGALGHNNWSMFPNFPSGDPRIVQVFLTPFGSFSGSGSSTVPITNFATFYVTGWTGQGGGFANPCQGNGDDPVPNNDAGYIVGHFIKYISALNSGGGGPALCNFNAFGNCVVVMTK